MYILKQHAFKIASSVFIVLILASTIITIKLFSAQADSSTVIPLDHGGTEVTARTTNYSGDDTNPPSDAIDWPANAGYPTVHNTVGGSGTFADPITVAINSKNGPDGDVPDGPYQIGEKFYVPRLHLYFVVEDSCNIDIDFSDCTNNGSDKDNSTQLHMDLFNGDSSDGNALQSCETSYGGDTQVIANAGDGYPMPDQYPNGTSLFNSANQCIGATLWNQYSGWTVGTSDTQSSSTPTTTTPASPTSTTTTPASPTSTTTTPASPTPTTTTSNLNNTVVLLPTPTDIDDSVQGTDLNQFHYVGSGWHHCQDCDTNNVGFYNNSNSWDSTAGNYVSIKFTGIQIKFYGVVGTHHGIGAFSLDGGAKTDVDFYAPTEAGNTLLYTSPTLTAGQHTLKVTVTGRQNSNAITSHVNPDHVQILSGTSPTPPAAPALTPSSKLPGAPSPTPSSSTGVTNPLGTGKDALDPTASNPDWKSVWADDFPAGSVDTSKWTIRNYPAGSFNNEQECYKNDGTHTRIDGTGADSHLVLEADAQSGNSSCPYISGRLDTQGKFAVQPPTAGKPVRVEASIQLPQGGNGTWPAFWLLGQNIDSVGWPDCGEIDVMENSGLRNMSAATTQGTVHGLNNASSYGTYTLSKGSLSDGYHLLEMDWSTTGIVFSVDGHPYVDQNGNTKTISTAQLGGDQVFNQPFFILLNFAVGGDWPGKVDSSTPFPQQMNVDFVRVYQHV